METSTYILLAFILFVVVRAVLQPKTPIPETSTRITKITSLPELEALLSSTADVVVDFYADWCPPCRAIAPVFSQLADAHALEGKLAFAKVNVDHVQDVAGRYGVSAMPTFLVFRDGAVRGVKVDAPGMKGGRQSVVLDSEGGIERIRGADRGALVAVVEALAGAVRKE